MKKWVLLILIVMGVEAKALTLYSPSPLDYLYSVIMGLYSNDTLIVSDGGATSVVFIINGSSTTGVFNATNRMLTLNVTFNIPVFSGINSTGSVSSSASDSNKFLKADGTWGTPAGTGDFLKDGSVAMTGNLDLGGQTMSNGTIAADVTLPDLSGTYATGTPSYVDTIGWQLTNAYAPSVLSGVGGTVTVARAGNNWFKYNGDGTPITLTIATADWTTNDALSCQIDLVAQTNTVAFPTNIFRNSGWASSTNITQNKTMWKLLIQKSSGEDFPCAVMDY